MWEVWAFDGRVWFCLVLGASSIGDAINYDLGYDLPGLTWEKVVVCKETDRPVGVAL